MAEPSMATHQPHTPAPTPKPRSTICPYCGSRSRNLHRCDACRGLFDPLSRQATQNAMGPWFIRDDAHPHRPGCSYETLVRMIDRGQVTLESVIRGPSTLQFWTLARWAPGVAHLLGVCHSCGNRAEPTDPACARCGAPFRVSGDRQGLGLGEIRYVPGRGAPEMLQGTAPAADEPAAPSGKRPEPDAAVEDAQAAARHGRMARQLAVSRRWTVVWCVAFVLLALAVVAVLMIPVLDLDAGPVGRWLRGRPPVPGEVQAPDLGGAPREIVPGDEAIPSPDTPPSPGLDTDGGAPGIEGSSGDDSPGVAPGDSEQSPDKFSGADSGADDSLLIYKRLRRLR